MGENKSHEYHEFGGYCIRCGITQGKALSRLCPSWEEKSNRMSKNLTPPVQQKEPPSMGSGVADPERDSEGTAILITPAILPRDGARRQISDTEIIEIRDSAGDVVGFDVIPPPNFFTRNADREGSPWLLCSCYFLGELCATCKAAWNAAYLPVDWPTLERRWWRNERRRIASFEEIIGMASTAYDEESWP